jgi:putative transposase
MALGPTTPQLRPRTAPPAADWHQLPAGHVVHTKAVLGGLHHEYWLEKLAA